MTKGTTAKRIKLGSEVPDSELLSALKNSMHPIFAHFEEEIEKSGGKVLHIEVTAEAGKVKLNYGFSDIGPSNATAQPIGGWRLRKHKQSSPADWLRQLVRLMHMHEPNRKEMLADAEYLKGLAAGMKDERLKRAAEALEDAGNHVCAQGYYGCYMGEKCTSDHK